MDGLIHDGVHDIRARADDDLGEPCDISGARHACEVERLHGYALLPQFLTIQSFGFNADHADDLVAFLV